MMNYISLGPVPCEEECAQLGQPDYSERSYLECHRYIGTIRRALGWEPPKAKLAVKHFPHDFGTYREVVCYYDTEDAATTEYACRCDAEGPTRWDDTPTTAMAPEEQL